MNEQLKIAAINFFAASLGRISNHPGTLRVLTFHDISDDSNDLYAVSKQRFNEYLSLLKNEGYQTIRACDLVSDFCLYLSKKRVVLLTFDDGCISNKDIVADLLVKHNMTATFFVISSMLAQYRKSCMFSAKERMFLSVYDLEQMSLSGFEIGSHSHTHAMLGMIPQEQVNTEVLLSKQIIEDAIGRDVVSFAYPFGQKNAFSANTRSLLEKNGYIAGFSQEGIRISRNSDMLRLSRTSIDRFDTLKTFRRKLDGNYDLIGNMKY